MEKSKPVVVGIGELLWDVFPDVKKAGGAPINFVYHATQLGAEGYAISAVGNDVFGTEIIQELDKNGIDSNYGEFYQFNLSSCIRQQNSLTAQFVSFSLSNLANIFYPPQFLQ